MENFRRLCCAGNKKTGKDVLKRSINLIKHYSSTPTLKGFVYLTDLAAPVEVSTFPSNELSYGAKEAFGFWEHKFDALMVRKPTQELFDALTLFQEDRDAYQETIGAKRFLLTGPRHVGKSVALAQVVNKAREDGWLSLYIPSGRHLMFNTCYVEPSPYHPGMFTSLHTCRQICQHFLKAHSDQLKGLPLQNSDTFGERYGKHTFDDLSQFVQFGATNLEHASYVVADLRDELMKIEALPVLVAVDEYDSFFRDSGFWWEYIPVRGEQFLAVKALMEVSATIGSTKELANGLSICAISKRFPLKKKEVPFESKLLQSIPNDTVVFKEYGRYSDEELEAYLEICEKLEFDCPDLQYLNVITQKNPYLVSMRMYGHMTPEDDSDDLSLLGSWGNN